MNDVIIYVKTETGTADKKNLCQTLGNQHQNLQNKLKFEMDKIIEGVAWLEYEIDGAKKYALMERYENGYQIDIKSCLLISDHVSVDIKITEEENPNGIPVFISTIVTYPVSETINAKEEEPDEYPDWKDVISSKLAEFENAEKVRNANEETRKTNEETREKSEEDREKYIADLKEDISNGELNGATFTPSVSAEGDLSFTNDKGLDNPETVNIRGPQGSIGPQGQAFTIKKTYSTIDLMKADYDNMKVNDYVMIDGNIEESENATLWVKQEIEDSVYRWHYLADFSGATGIQGEQGPQGPQGIQGPIGPQGQKGDTGNGIVSIVKSATNGLVDTYTVTFMNGNTTTFDVTNGQNGEVTEEQLNEVKKDVKNNSNKIIRVQDSAFEEGQAEGTSIHIEDSINGEFKELEVSLNEEQKTTKGNQLIDFTTFTTNANTNYTFENDVLTINGVSSYSRISKDITNLVKSNPGKTLYFNFASINKNMAKSPIIQLKIIATNNNASYISLAKSDGKKTSYIIPTNMSDIVTVFLEIHSNNTSEEADTTFIITKPILQFGTDEKEYEFYTGGQPSPSPDYPQDVPIKTGSFDLISCSKNLLKYNDNLIPGYSKTVNGITYKVEDDLSITINGTATKKSEIYLYGAWNVKNNSYLKERKITISNQGLVNGSHFIFFLFDNAISVYSNTLSSKIKSFTADLNSIKHDGLACLITVLEGTTISSANIKIMLESGTTVNKYEPYFEKKQTFTIPNEEFIGKVNDTIKDKIRIAYNESDSNYHLVLNKMVGKIVLDGSENWNISSNYSDVYYINKPADLKSGTTNLLSNYFCNFDTSISNVVNYGIVVGNLLNIKNKDIVNSVDKFKNWLSTHNVEIYYPLATPYTIDLGIVDMPKTYTPVTNAYIISDLEMKINAKYYKDPKIEIKNLKDEVNQIKELLSSTQTSALLLDNYQNDLESEV